MTSNYTIWIVSPPELVWSHVFDEVAIGLQSAFSELRYEVPIVTDPSQISGTAIVFGAHLTTPYNIKLPDDCIIYNLEQVHSDSPRFKPEYGYIDLLKKYPVWDFSRINIQELEKMGVENVIHCDIGYAPELTHIRRKKEDIDVLFVGGGHPRRDKIFNEITGRGVRFQQVFRIFGKERDDFIARGKVHLNLHKEPANVFEIARVSYLLANKCFVISETGADREIEERFKDGLVFCEYDKLVENCLHYLVNPKERKRIAEQGFELFKKMPQSEFLAAALEEHFRVHIKKKQKPLGKSKVIRPRIFVAIPSYRDPEINPTLTDLFAKATYPDRINAGVCLQVDADKEKDCLVDLPERAAQIRIAQYRWQDSGGANWARDKALALINDEEYVLLVDSHMRFEQGWDEMLIDMLARCPSKKPIISAYCPNYDPPDNLAVEPRFLLRMRVRGIDPVGKMHVISLSGTHVLVSQPDERLGLYPTPFCIANCMFTRASTLKEVPLDPNIHFWGDEMDYAARLWTHGYDIFQPDRVVMYHCWVRKEMFPVQHYREHMTPRNLLSLQRVNHLLGFSEAKNAEALVDIDRYGLGQERSLEDLWEFAGIDWKQKKFTAKAGEGLWNMKVMNKIMSEKKADNKLPRIFVAVASYRDPDCQWTIKDLFDKAKYSERISVGICWQFIKGKDDNCFKQPYPFPKQVRVKEVDEAKSRGLGWARAEAQKLWDDEEYTLQIDSSSRFEKGWDEILLSMWNKCENDKAVLTCYPPEFTPPDQYKRSWIFGMTAREFNADSILNVVAAPSYEVGLPYPAQPLNGAFASNRMLFAPSSIINDVPCDPYLYCDGGDVAMAVRLWTSGYDLYHPNSLVLFHGDDSGTRKTYRADHKDWVELNQQSLARVAHLLGTKSSDDKAVIKELDDYGIGEERSLAEYQDYSGVDFVKKKITAKAREGKYEQQIAQKKPKISLVTNRITGKQPKIFVNIASYRDPECQWTVKDLFEKAKYPDRIHVGICWQFDAEEDKHCFEVVTRPEQVSVVPVDWREAEGVCWARSQTQALWDGEDYTFMTDSHMRFVPGWDEFMISELALCESDKPLLSSSPASYEPPNQLGSMMRPTFRRVKPFTPAGNMRCQAEAFDRSPPKPLNGAFVVCNNIFSRSEITPEVPYDPYLYFDQEEITYSARLYTHGWDVFSASKQFLYHYYNKDGASVRPLHWTDLRKKEEERIKFFYDRGLRRFNHLTRHSLSYDNKIIVDLEKYGFGKVRSLDDYEEYTGIDFRRKVASDKALRGLFIKDIAKYRDRPVRVPEIDDAKPNTATKVTVNVPKEITSLSKNTAAEVKQELVTGKTATRLLPAMLEPGDFIPLFSTTDTAGSHRAIEVYGGKHVILVFLPGGNVGALNMFFVELHKQSAQAKLQNMWQIFVINDTVENLNAFKEKTGVNHLLWTDPEGKIGRSFGVARRGEDVQPTGFVLNPNLQIMHRHTNVGPARMAEGLVRDCGDEITKYKEKNKEPRIVSELPPALIVPNVLSPEFCRKCIQAFHDGHTFEGTVGASASTAYKPDTKVRTDHIVGGALLEELDYKLSRSFFPEIEKIFGFKVTYREFYKIGLYKGEKKGFFKQHRDNFDAPLGYRRVASTIHLNDDYEGGGLRFPEYDDNTYRPAAGSGIAFSCQTQHEARPVTKGERYIIVAFLHGDEDEAYRRHYVTAKGEPIRVDNYLATLRDYPEISPSRNFFKEWRDKNVIINWEGDDKSKPMLAEQSKPASSSNVVIRTIGEHKCNKIFESKYGIIFDDFLPENVYQKIYDLSLKSAYENSKTSGKTSDGWQVHSGFPQRSTIHYDYYANSTRKSEKKDSVWPSKTDLDQFADYVIAVQPYVSHLIGKANQVWDYFSVAPWMYPHGTSMSIEGGKGGDEYSGAYIYSLNPTWYMHWGGLLLLADGGKSITKSIMPKRNRMVFIASDAYRMLTRIDEQSGDNVRRTLTGFFHRKK